jgi:hypothetical protein
LNASDFILYKYNTVTSNWDTVSEGGSKTTNLVVLSSDQGTDTNYYESYMITFNDLSSNPLWSLLDGYYQLAVNPSKYTGISDEQGDYYSYGDTSAQANTMFYRLFGDARGTGLIGNTDAFYFNANYGKTDPTTFARWSFYSFSSGTAPIGNTDAFRFNANYNKSLTIPIPKPLP